MEATVAADQAALENARLQLSFCSIRSPVTGRVGTLNVNAGNVVKDLDTVLVTINQTQPIYVGPVPDPLPCRRRAHWLGVCRPTSAAAVGAA